MYEFCQEFFHSKPSLIFAHKAGAYKSGDPYLHRLHSSNGLLALTANSRLGQKSNGIDKHSSLMRYGYNYKFTSVKDFIVHSHCVIVIKLSSSQTVRQECFAPVNIFRQVKYLRVVPEHTLHTTYYGQAKGREH